MAFLRLMIIHIFEFYQKYIYFTITNLGRIIKNRSSNKFKS